MSALRDIEPVLPDGTFYRLEYNGFRFDPAATETLGISCKPMQDNAKRTIKFVEITLRVRSVIYVQNFTLDNFVIDGDTTDDKMDNIVQRLTSQGAYLVYQGKGFGHLNINTGKLAGTKNSAQWDVKWGPTPLGLECKPIGDNRAWEIIWGVSVCIPECDQARYMDTIMSFCYEVEYVNDYGGYVTRNVTGELEIPLTRPNQGDRRITKTADDYRDQIVVQCPAGFRAINPGTFKLSQDRTTLAFSFSHEQLPGIVPPLGVLKCSMDMKINNANRLDFTTWYFTINAKYEMAAGRFQIVAADHFRRVIADRIIRLTRETNKARKKQPVPNQGAGVLPIRNGGQGPIRNGVENGVIIGGGVGGIGGAIIGGFAGGLWAAKDQPGKTAGAAQAAMDAANAARVEAEAKANAKNGGQGPPQVPPPQISGGPVTVNDGGGLVTQLAFIAAAAALGVANGGRVGNGQNAAVVMGEDLDALLIPNDCMVMPIFYTSEDPDAYGPPRASFSCTLFVTCTLPQFLNAGLWEPVVDTPTHSAWKKSLGKIWNNRGIPNARFNPTDDVIIDLCRPSPDENGIPSTLKGKPDDDGKVLRGSANESANPMLGGNNWIAWKNDITFRQDNDIISVKVLPTDSVLAPNSIVSGANQTVPADWNPGDQFNIVSGSFVPAPASKFSSRTAPDYSAVMEGFAVCVGEPPSPPELVSIGGIPAVLCMEDSKHEVIGNTAVPVYKTSWKMLYRFPQSTGASSPPGGTSSLRSQGTPGGATSSSLNSFAVGGGGTPNGR